MKKKIKERKAMKRLLMSFVLVVALLVVPVAGALAATDTVTVTATPSFVGIGNSPSDWTLNNATGSGTGKIEPATTYYSNPGGEVTAPSTTVLVGECLFTITNTSNEATNVSIDISDFSGGDDNMTNSDLGTNDTTSFGAYSWYEGMTYTGKVIAKTTGSDNLISGLAANTDLNWGMEVTTQSNAWTGPASSTATITITITAV